MFSTNYHLKLLAKTEEALGDGTFWTTPPPWKQSFIISAKVTSDVFVPCIFVLLPDKKRESYDAMFSMVAECRGLELSATYFMSGRTWFSQTLFELTIHFRFRGGHPGFIHLSLSWCWSQRLQLPLQQGHHLESSILKFQMKSSEVAVNAYIGLKTKYPGLEIDKTGILYVQIWEIF